MDSRNKPPSPADLANRWSAAGSASTTTGTPSSTVVELPLGTPRSVFFLDESGSKGTGGKFFVVGGVKVRSPGHLLREIKAVRDRHRYFGELKFSELTHGSVPVFRDIIRALAESDTHLIAYVIDKSVRDPFAGVPQWEAHAEVAAQLLHGNINRAEITTLLMDACSSPVGVAIDEVISDKVNNKIGSINLVSAVSLDSRSTDGLQLADLVASSVSFNRRAAGKAGSPKAIVSAELAAAFGLSDFRDIRTKRVNILTSRPKMRASSHSPQKT